MLAAGSGAGAVPPAPKASRFCSASCETSAVGGPNDGGAPVQKAGGMPHADHGWNMLAPAAAVSGTGPVTPEAGPVEAPTPGSMKLPSRLSRRGWRISQGVPQSLGVCIPGWFVQIGVSSVGGKFDTDALGLCGTRSSQPGVGGKPPRSLRLPVAGPALSLPRRVPRWPQLLPTDPGGSGELGAKRPPIAFGDSGDGNGSEAWALGTSRVALGSAGAGVGSSLSNAGRACASFAAPAPGKYVMISRPFDPSTRNSDGCEARKCLRPWSVFFKYKREPGESATPNMLSSSGDFPGMLMCCRHSSKTFCRVTPKASISSSWLWS
mmetsp:Transcript_22352/g.51830  ORF Transcript_22352/g.51830 Transcript_22352/m.51830 type:complete len:322 (+) Transcript_22352:956-1921(+)